MLGGYATSTSSAAQCSTLRALPARNPWDRVRVLCERLSALCADARPSLYTFELFPDDIVAQFEVSPG